ncbi:6-phosphogluconolactonase [Paenibacillus shirakamiensis]|uniref:6-phosphogluconolactonase n=1 Tax=Paenibacillus shirakamiensis TaxID=1265935 RepID=A0ABS4JIS4_9BACL|nr:lactonase family protein [Paenibacillus shirakamiensis]MBP2001607.1 6-phosphogluconolactonase [Paenibacillus shirakamiensis]
MTNQLKRDDEVLLYVGSYSAPEDGGIHLTALNTKTGEIRLVHTTTGIENPSFLILNEPMDKLYAVSETEDGEVVAYNIDTAEGRLSELNRQSTGGYAPCYVSITPDHGGELFVVNYISAEVSSYQLREDWSITDVVSRIKHEGKGFDNDRQDSAHAHSIVIDQEGTFAYVSDLGLDQIVIYKIEEDGSLKVHRKIELPQGAGPRHFKIHSSHKWAYGINELNNTVTLYNYDEEEGNLEIVQHISTLPDHFTGETTTAEVAISPCGRYLYGSNRGHDSIVRYIIDESTGRLSDPQWVSSGGSGPRHFTILDEGLLVVAHQYTNNLVSFKIDPDQGLLHETGYTLSVSKPVCVTRASGLNN